MSRVLQPVERGVYRVIGVREDDEQSWIKYLVATFIVTVVSVLLTFLLLRFQDRVPLQSVVNPQGLPGVAPDLAMNTALSFATNTNWQNYAGETTMTYFSQMVAPGHAQLPLSRHGVGPRHGAHPRAGAAIR